MDNSEENHESQADNVDDFQRPSAKEVFGSRADRYDQLEIFSQEKHYLPLLEFAAPEAGDIALDLATGTGLLARLLARTAKEVTGIDVTPEMLIKARARAEDSGLMNTIFVETEAANLPFPGSTFSLVTCRTAFHHFTEPEKVLREVNRVLKPGGRLVIADVVGYYGRGQDRSLRERLERLIDPSHVLTYTADEFTSMLEESGFKVERLLEPETEPLPLKIILRLEKIEQPEVREQITSILVANTNSDLGGLDIMEIDGKIALRWHVIFIAARKSY